jgi:hypothetical protein
MQGAATDERSSAVADTSDQQWVIGRHCWCVSTLWKLLTPIEQAWEDVLSNIVFDQSTAACLLHLRCWMAQMQCRACSSSAAVIAHRQQWCATMLR